MFDETQTVACPHCDGRGSCCRCRDTRRVPFRLGLLSNSWDVRDCTSCDTCSRLRRFREAIEASARKAAAI